MTKQDEKRLSKAKIDSLFWALLGCPTISAQWSDCPSPQALKFPSMHVLGGSEEYEQRLAVANDIREVPDESRLCQVFKWI